MTLLENGEPSSLDPVTLNEDSDWSGGWVRLNRYADNEEITYDISEGTVPDYTCEVSIGLDEDGNMHATVTNSYVPNDPPVPDDPPSPNPPTPDEPGKPGKPGKPSIVPRTMDQSLDAAIVTFELAAVMLAVGAALKVYTNRVKHQS